MRTLGDNAERNYLSRGCEAGSLLPVSSPASRDYCRIRYEFGNVLLTVEASYLSYLGGTQLNYLTLDVGSGFFVPLRVYSASGFRLYFGSNSSLAPFISTIDI